MADASDDVLNVVAKLRVKVDKGQLSRYRRGESKPREKTKRLIEQITAPLGRNRVVRANGWAVAS